MKKQKDKRLDTPLAKAFDFTHGDLEANRAGFISHRQKRKLWLKFWVSDLNGCGLFFGLFTLLNVMGIISLGIMFLFGYFPEDSLDVIIVQFFLGSCLVALFGTFGLAMILSVRNGYTQQKAELEQGTIETFHWSIKDKKIERVGSSSDFLVLVNKTYYGVSWKQYEILEDDKPYTFHITPTSKKILSVEPIEIIKDE